MIRGSMRLIVIPVGILTTPVGARNRTSPMASILTPLSGVPSIIRDVDAMEVSRTVVTRSAQQPCRTDPAGLKLTYATHLPEIDGTSEPQAIHIIGTGILSCAVSKSVLLARCLSMQALEASYPVHAVDIFTFKKIRLARCACALSSMKMKVCADCASEKSHVLLEYFVSVPLSSNDSFFEYMQDAAPDISPVLPAPSTSSAVMATQLAASTSTSAVPSLQISIVLTSSAVMATQLPASTTTSAARSYTDATVQTISSAVTPTKSSIEPSKFSAEVPKTPLSALPASLAPAPTYPIGSSESLPEPLYRHQCHFCDKTFTFGHNVRRYKRLIVQIIIVACHISCDRFKVKRHGSCSSEPGAADPGLMSGSESLIRLGKTAKGNVYENLVDLEGKKGTNIADGDITALRPACSDALVPGAVVPNFPFIVLVGIATQNCSAGCKGGETGNTRENTPTSGIVPHDSHLRRSGVTWPGIELNSPWWQQSSLIVQPPRPNSDKARIRVSEKGRQGRSSFAAYVTLAVQPAARLSTARVYAPLDSGTFYLCWRPLEANTALGGKAAGQVAQGQVPALSDNATGRTTAYLHALIHNIHLLLTPKTRKTCNVFSLTISAIPLVRSILPCEESLFVLNVKPLCYKMTSVEEIVLAAAACVVGKRENTKKVLGETFSAGELRKLHTTLNDKQHHVTRMDRKTLRLVVLVVVAARGNGSRLEGECRREFFCVHVIHVQYVYVSSELSARPRSCRVDKKDKRTLQNGEVACASHFPGFHSSLSGSTACHARRYSDPKNYSYSNTLPGNVLRISTRTIANDRQTHRGKYVCTKTIRNRIYNAGYKARAPRQKPYIAEPTSRGAVGWCATTLGCKMLWVRIPACSRTGGREAAILDDVVRNFLLCHFCCGRSFWYLVCRNFPFPPRNGLDDSPTAILDVTGAKLPLSTYRHRWL
ncbi:hypothetical protein PR048_001003 [Dryococelus australis]|uniref:Transposase Tc1-like domain-containing protein n=1 Tax=Dryococelus australis TaxID=614101 RepID=A0ABQ9IG63_9NEOP|nr:hypothetical protein PR048_001003 [Dryococelus australis]